MATTSSKTKAKPDNKKPKLPSSVSSEDGSDQKPARPLPNYLKPTLSSRPDPVKSVKKNNNNLDDNQKLLRRRSFDRPPSSLTSPSTSSPRIQKSLNVSPSRTPDRPTNPREKPVTAQRSSSFHGSRGVPRGGTTVKSLPVAPKKSGLRSSTTSMKNKKEGSANVTTKKASDKDITIDSASLSSTKEDEEEILEVANDVQVADDIEEPKTEEKHKEVLMEVVQADESGEENEISEPTTVASPGEEDCIVVLTKADEKEQEQEPEQKQEQEQELINEDKTEEMKEQENNQIKKDEDKEEVKKKIDEDETPEKVEDDMKEVESVQDTKEEVIEEKNKENVKEEEKENKEEEKEKVKEEESGEGKNNEVVIKGKKESSSAYNDVIASKLQENPRKNKVLALAGAFQTVIDYETAASK